MWGNPIGSVMFRGLTSTQVLSLWLDYVKRGSVSGHQFHNTSLEEKGASYLTLTGMIRKY